jgi:hypothetical protein
MKKINLKTKLKFDIDLNSIRGDSEKKINDKIKEMNNSDLSDYEKREAILKEENSSTYNSNKKNNFKINNTKQVKFYLNIKEIIKEYNKFIEKKYNKIKDKNISDFDKRRLVLISDKTTTNNRGENELNNNENESNIIISEQKDEHEERKEMDTINSINNSSIADKPTADTLSQAKEDSFDIFNLTFIQEKTNPNCISFYNEESKTFNAPRNNYLLKNKLYDYLLKRPNNTLFLPEKYRLGHDQYIYAYPNNTNTYSITISERFNKNKEAKAQKDLIQDKNYNKSLGLCFCGKFIEELKMKCAPNQFMCKECMEINKEKYNLSEKYLINMNGRVARNQKGNYQCCGLFVVKNDSDFVICGAKFTCESCNLLNKYSKYYSS